MTGSSGAGSSSSGSSGGGSSSGNGSSSSSSSGGSSSSSGSGSSSGGGQGDGGGSEGGTAEGGAAEGGGSDGGNCAGMAIPFNLNVPTANDPAAQRVMADLASDLPIGNALRTVEWWAYVLPTSWKGDSNTMFEYGDQVVTNGGFGFDFGTNQSATMGTIDPYTNGTFDDDNQPSGIANPGTPQWIHFALSWDGTALQAFVNGVLEATKMAGGMLAMGPNASHHRRKSPWCRFQRQHRRVSSVEHRTHGGRHHEHDAQDAGGQRSGLGRLLEVRRDHRDDRGRLDHHGGPHRHPGTLMSATGFALPTWVASTAPITCP